MVYEKLHNSPCSGFGLDEPFGVLKIVLDEF